MIKRIQEIALGDFRISILVAFFTFECIYFVVHAQRKEKNKTICC
jgi:hypothetical protein